MNDKDIGKNDNNGGSSIELPISKIYVNNSQSSSVFFHSAPIELTTVEGYNQFIKKLEKKNNRTHVTVLKEDLSQGYILEDGDVIANIYGEAKNYLVSLACNE